MSLAVILLAVVLPIFPKIEFNFEVILYILILVFLSPGSCFKSMICYQNSISKQKFRHVCAAAEGRKKSSPERFEEHLLLNIPF